MTVRQTSSYPQSDVPLSHVKRPDSVAEAENTCSTGEYEFVVRQTTSYWPSNVQLSHAKRPGSVVEGQRTCSTSEEGLIVGQTPSYSPSNVSYLTSNAQIVLPRPNARVVQVSLHLL